MLRRENWNAQFALKMEIENQDSYFDDIAAGFKSYFVLKRKFIQVNKRCKKKPSYHDIKSREKINKKLRLHTKSSLERSLRENDALNFALPYHSSKDSRTWWDCKPDKMKIFI